MCTHLPVCHWAIFNTANCFLFTSEKKNGRGLRGWGGSRDGRCHQKKGVTCQGRVTDYLAPWFSWATTSNHTSKVMAHHTQHPYKQTMPPCRQAITLSILTINDMAHRTLYPYKQSHGTSHPVTLSSHRTQHPYKQRMSPSWQGMSPSNLTDKPCLHVGNDLAPSILSNKLCPHVGKTWQPAMQAMPPSIPTSKLCLPVPTSMPFGKPCQCGVYITTCQAELPRHCNSVVAL